MALPQQHLRTRLWSPPHFRVHEDGIPEEQRFSLAQLCMPSLALYKLDIRAPGKKTSVRIEGVRCVLNSKHMV